MVRDEQGMRRARLNRKAIKGPKIGRILSGSKCKNQVWVDLIISQ